MRASTPHPYVTADAVNLDGLRELAARSGKLPRLSIRTYADGSYTLHAGLRVLVRSPDARPRHFGSHSTLLRYVREHLQPLVSALPPLLQHTDALPTPQFRVLETANVPAPARGRRKPGRPKRLRAGV